MGRLQDDSKRWSIVETAFRLFGELGFRATTMKHIADSAGIAPGSIYTYFRDKEELFQTAVEEGWREFRSAFNDAVESSSPLEQRVDALIDIGFQKLKESLPLLRGMLFEASRMPVFRDNLESFCLRVEALLEEGRRGGVLALERGGAWRRLVRVIVNGAMFTMAMAPDDGIDTAISDLTVAIKTLVRERIRQEGGA